MKPLPHSFYNHSASKVARELLGCMLIHKTKSFLAGKIVETEAYLENDPASHSFKEKTQRNAPMFSQAGNAYIYFTYGMHHCFNVVTNKKGAGEAVLLRALEPLQGIEIMKKNCNKEDIRQLCNGPAKLVQAVGITKANNKQDVTRGNVFIVKRKEKPTLIRTKRIGISNGKEKLLRFYIKDSSFVSKR